ncbi:MAG: hypothetical protein ABI670_16585 [Chloroflexota bacterium]
MYKVYKRIALMVALLMVVVPFLAACGGDNPTATPVAAPTNTVGTAPPTEATGGTNPTATTGETSATATTGGTSGGAKKKMQIIWFAWAPCQALADLSKKFPDAEVDVRCVPIGEWHSSIFTDFAAKQGADVVILDSQYIGEAVTGGHVLDLTDWMKTNIEMSDYVPAALSAYGEYPEGSGKYYGVPAEGDTQMIVYRKDAFEAAKADYKAQTGKDLEVPKKWTELLDVAKFFKANPDKYAGVKNGYTTFYCGTVACYDQIATHWNQILWSFGGELWDSKTYKVEGQINSDIAVKALDFDKELFKTGPEGQGNFQFNESVDALCSGTTAMTTIWFGFGAAFNDTKGCKNSANLAYAVAPGEDKHFISLGGMGLHVSSYTKDKDLALSYVKWFESKDTQIEWAKLGGFSARKSVLASNEFKNAAPYNPTFSEAYQFVKDFWNIPEYNGMLQTQMEQLNLAVTGQKDSKAALDEIARKQQSILDEAYPNGPPTGGGGGGGGTTAPTATTSAGGGTSGGAKKKMQIIWFAWAPCQALADLSKKFPDAEVDVRCVPIGEWHSSIFTDFAAKQGADVVILDSQYIGEAVTGGHVLDLTDWMKTNIEMSDYVPAALSAYGEYPAGSGKYYGVAAEGDTQMIVYRKDAFEAAKADYKAATGKDLVVPTKWTELLDVAKFFKANPDKYAGVKNGYTTFYCGTVACYDQIATHWNQILWSFGGELWDPATYKVDGFINSAIGVKALDFDKELFKTGPEGQGNFQFNESVDALCSGTTAMTTIWFGFGAAFNDTTGCKNSANLAYAVAPGEDKHFISLGGMGLHVSSYTKDKDLALSYVKWFESKDTQIEWAKLGGFSARKSVLASNEFKNAAPYNPTFSEAYQFVKDFWNIPEYNGMLQTQMEQLNLAVTGQKDSKAALDEIARKQQSILDEAYPNGPPK